MRLVHVSSAVVPAGTQPRAGEPEGRAGGVKSPFTLDNLDIAPWGVAKKKKPVLPHPTSSLLSSQLKPILMARLMHSGALEPPCDARSDELDQKIPAVRRPSKKPLE